MAWVRWGAVNLGILLALLLAGSLLLVPAGLVGWAEGEDLYGPYALLGIYLPFSGAAYLAALAFVAPRVRRPRAWAFALVPLFWAFVPFFAIAVNVPGIAALWIVILVFAALVRLPPPGDRTRDGAQGQVRS